MTFYADYSCNNGNMWPAKPYEYTTKTEAIRSIKKIMQGNHYQQSYNTSTCEVYHFCEDGKCILDYAGSVHDNSLRVHDDTPDDVRDRFLGYYH